MLNKSKIALFWSGGKDSARALWELQTVLQDRYEVVKLVTTINQHFGRISMHGVRESLLDQQANEIGLPLHKMYVSEQCSNEEYETVLFDTYLALKAEGITHIAFGDIFLEDLRQYREQLLAKVGLISLFPLWKRNTTDLIHEFIAAGFQTITCCVQSILLDETWVGRKIDHSFITELPPNIDPCGENGEFHTFCFAGPIFKNPIPITIGERVFKPYKDGAGFWFIDLN